MSWWFFMFLLSFPFSISNRPFSCVMHRFHVRLFSVETEEEKSIFDNPHHLLFDKNFTGTKKSEKTLINN